MKQYFDLLFKGSLKDYYRYLDDILNNHGKKFIITENPESIMKAETNKELQQILLNTANSFIPDGIAIVKKANKYKINIKERITGIEIATYLLNKCNEQKKSIYLFGAKPEVINDLVKTIKANYPKIIIKGYCDGYVKDKDKIFNQIRKLKPDVCLVALGIPEQELLINKHINNFEKGIFVGVGGSFDVLSGHKKRAPKIFIKLNLEWFYRIICEPKRIKRFIKSNVIFMLKK